jgi:[ribosomal protein S18]-alanine N-acetyltransferase
MPALVIRRMRREDINAVMAIDCQCFPVPWSENAFAAEVRNVSGYYLIAEAQGELCGYIGCWIIMDELHITTLGVDPRIRRRRIGERLLAAVLEEAARRGARRASLEVRAGNHAARQLYEKYGFFPISRRARYYTDNGEDALVMWIEDMTRPAHRQLLEARFAALRGD